MKIWTGFEVFVKKTKTKKDELKKKGAPMNPNLVRMVKGSKPKLKAGIHPDDVENHKSKGWAVDDVKS